MSAIGSNVVTRIVGYELSPRDFSLVSPNLPARIAILAEANDDMQSGLTANVGVQITNQAGAAAIGGWGSPIHQIAKILFPTTGSILGSIPVIVYPQAKAGGAVAKVQTVTATGTATAGGTIYVVVAGRKYSVNIASGDTPTVIHTKIANALNAELVCPMIAVGAAGQATLTAKWSGLTSQGITTTVDLNNSSIGVTFAVAQTTPGSGTPAVTTALTNFGTQWITHVINSYDLTATTVLDALEAANGKPKTSTTPASGKYLPTVFKPFVALTGSVDADPSASTDSRKNNLTIQVCTAPSSPGLAMEAAANWCLLSAYVMQNTPHLDIIGLALPDMPVPSNGSIGVMADWAERDRIVKLGCSTVDFIGGQYIIQDPVTTYHPVGEVVPQFRYSRILFIDWNVRFGYMLKEETNVVGHVIANDDEIVNASKVVKPKMWLSVLIDYFEQLVGRGLIVDAAFSAENTTVGLSTVNPDRFETSFQYKRSGLVRQADTTAEAGFNFGTLNAN